MKKLLILLPFSFISLLTLGQNNYTLKWENYFTSKASSSANVFVDCTQEVATCNYVYNSGMLTNSQYDGNVADPFSQGFITNWGASHGTPNIDDNLNPTPPFVPPFAGIHAAYMYTNRTPTTLYWAEGLVGKIKKLTPNKEYTLSFFKQIIISDLANSNNEYEIYLMHCSDAPAYFPNNSPTAIYPTPPPNSQKIFCATNLATDYNWLQHTLCFTPNQDYDMIWVYPKITSFINPVRCGMAISFAHPEILNKTDFSINVRTDVTNPCIKNLSCCSVVNASYKWYLNGVLFSTLANPQINTTSQYGTVTVEVTLPNNPINNSCSPLPCSTLQASLNILQCPPSSSGSWVWMNGPNTANQPPVWGTQGVPSPSNNPGARMGAVTWTDTNDNLWLYGGRELYTGANVQNYLADLWKYDKSINQWTWISGSTTLNQAPQHGTQGVPNSSNWPGGRKDCGAWTDNAGNLWLFGGLIYTPPGATSQNLNDLWKYDINTNQWVWIKGSNIPFQIGSYGTKGVSSASNTPGSKSSTISCKDGGGNLWLFGGDTYTTVGNVILNDLWKYNISTNEWVWMKGDNTTVTSPSTHARAVYGSQGIPSSTNTPGAKADAFGWSDINNGYLWVFGGLGYDASTSGYLNDLWRYEVATNQWTWMKGDNVVNQPGFYGTQGVPANKNRPSARRSPVGWGVYGNNLWLYGGSPTSSGIYSDFWKFNITTNQWTWVSGSNQVTQIAPVHGTLGVGSATTYPGSRSWSSVWNTNSGSFWLYGGSWGSGLASDLWKYVGNCPNPSSCFTGVSISNLTTKVSTQNDALKAAISPNPTTTNLTLRITENDKQSLAGYNLTVTDKMGGVLLRQANYTSGRGVDISRLEKGVYFATITNNKNEKVTVAFSKL